MSEQKRLPKSLAWKYDVKKFIAKDSCFVDEEKYLIREEKYTIFINGKKFTSVMLVPQLEKEFVYGFLFTSRIIDDVDDIKDFRMCENKNIYIYLKNLDFEFQDEKWTVTSGCGGGKVLEKTYSDFEKISIDFKITAKQILEMFKRLESESNLHAFTRCVHKAYYFGSDGFEFTCEDVGRHNTIDKVIGAVLLNKRSFDGVVLTTGRLTSEMMLKCARAKIPIVVSRTAPSKLGLEIAKNANITMIGLTSLKGFTVFNGVERVII